MPPVLTRLLVALFLILPNPVQAQVVATFYSHEFGESFPHAFFTLQGRTIMAGTPVDANYGFTAKAVTPAILLGSVPGQIDIATSRYIASSEAHFSVALSDEQYFAMLAVVEKWRTRKSPSYNLTKANCVHFIGEAARAAGLVVTFPAKLMRKPHTYLLEIGRLNPTVTPLRR